MALGTGELVGIGANLLGGLFGGGKSLTEERQEKVLLNQLREWKFQKALRDEALADLEKNRSLFDPSSLLKGLYAEDFRNQELENKATGAGFAAAGYRQGDTPVGDAFTRSNLQHRQFRDQLALEIPRQLYTQYMGLKQGIANPNSTLLANANQTASSIPQRPNFAAQLFQATLPYLNPQKAPTQPNPYYGQATTLPPIGQLPSYGDKKNQFDLTFKK